MLSSTLCGVGSSVGLRPAAPACTGVAASASSTTSDTPAGDAILAPWWGGVKPSGPLPSMSEVYFLDSSRMDSGTEAEERRFQEGELTAPAQPQQTKQGVRGGSRGGGWNDGGAFERWGRSGHWPAMEQLRPDFHHWSCFKQSHLKTRSAATQRAAREGNPEAPQPVLTRPAKLSQSNHSFAPSALPPGTLTARHQVIQVCLRQFGCARHLILAEQ